MGALRRVNIGIDSGLAEDELRAAEAEFGCAFPPDLQELLAVGLPRGLRALDWRQIYSESLSGRMKRPIEGICFDVEHNGFWMAHCGSRPAGTEEALDCSGQSNDLRKPNGHHHLW